MAAKKPEQKLVSMTFIKPYSRYTRGDRAGFPPDRAKELEARKVAIPSAQAKQEAAKKPADEPKGTEGADKA
ncbi:hypothetical protein [uncultured Halomonas sp.]|uniref:hypothetical protein n=1 Tax=uncultured Halomonas sp. TaxID=173971 RepID=UPI00261B907C|nr:hypothetical protein [uncultured Halomonas sp.]